VKAELADKAAGTISDTDRIAINLWMIDNAPTEQSYNDMKELMDTMVVETKDGTAVGDKESILKNLGRELERTNQPRLTYYEKYALREELMDSVKESDGLVDDLEKAKEVHDDIKDTVDTITGDPSERLGEIDKAQREGWEKDGSSPGAGAMKNLETAKKVLDAGTTIHGERRVTWLPATSRTLAVTKAVTHYGVDLGVNTLMEKNPVMKVVNTALKYSEPIVGKDITPAKGWRIITDRAFDSYTGELDHKDVEKLDFKSTEVKDAVKDGQAKALEKRLASSGLSDDQRREITDRLRELRNNSWRSVRSLKRISGQGQVCCLRQTARVAPKDGRIYLTQNDLALAGMADYSSLSPWRLTMPELSRPVRYSRRGGSAGPSQPKRAFYFIELPGGLSPGCAFVSEVLISLERTRFGGDISREKSPRDFIDWTKKRLFRFGHKRKGLPLLSIRKNP